MSSSDTARSRRGLLLVLSGNMLVDALEVSTAMVALPSVAADLHLGTSDSSWVVTGFALGFGGLLLLGNRLVAGLGARRVYLAALLVFALASLAAALAPGAGLLVAARFVKGFCVALTAPTGLAIIAATHPEGPARNRAVSVYSLFGAAGFSVGLVLAGILTGISWRWTMAAPAPVVLLLLLLAVRVIPPDPPRTGAARRLDLPGAASLAGGLALLLVAIGHGTPAAWAGAVLLLGTFVVVETRSPDPLLALGGVRSAGLLRSALGAALLNGTFWGFLFVMMTRWQGAEHRSALVAALWVLPASLLLGLAAPLSARFLHRAGAARLILLGATAATAGYVLLLPLDAGAGYPAHVLPGVLLVGTGFVGAFSALHVQAVAGVPAPRQALAGGIYQSCVQIGGAILLAVVAAVAGRSPQHAMELVAAAAAVGVGIALTAFVPQRSVSTRPAVRDPGTV